MGLVLVGAGLFVLANSSMIADRISPYVSPPPDPSAGITGSGFSEGYLTWIVWGFGFSLIGSGGAILRGAFMSPVGSGLMGGGIDPTEIMGSYMQSMSTAQRTGAPPPRTAPSEVIRIKCRNCGSLEAEDAAYCRKCGEPL